MTGSGSTHAFRGFFFIILLGIIQAFQPLAVQAQGHIVGQWDRFEIKVTNPRSYANPYHDVSLDVTYTRPDGSTVAFWGFYDGGTTWKLRFMPDGIGRWQYRARFSDSTSEITGTFDVVEAHIPGMISRDEINPQWFGFKGGGHVLIRSFHVGDRFFASNWPTASRTAFLDWAQSQGYNMLSVASHYLNRNVSGRGAGWETPDLWPLNAAEYRELEAILDDLARRRIMVYPFAGFFGRDSDYPRQRADQTRYIRYTLARLGAYWNVLLNVAGPEPNIDNYLSSTDVNRLGGEIQSLDVFGHLLSVHNKDGLDPYRHSTWSSYVTVQGPETTSQAVLSAELLKNRMPNKPLYAQETMWAGNTLQPAYSDTTIRKHTWVINTTAAVLNFADMNGNSSSGFSGTMDLSRRVQSRHDIVKRVWDFFETIPFYTMSPRQDLVSTGYCLAAVGQRYLVYLPSRTTLNIALASGTYNVEWINGQNPGDRRPGGTTTTGQNLAPPSDGDDWAVYLTRTDTGGEPADPTIRITSPLNGQTFTAPANVAIAAEVADPAGSVYAVQFFSGSTKLAEDTVAPYEFVWSGVDAGVYSISAATVAADGSRVVSGPVHVTISNSAGLAVVSLTLIDADSDQVIAEFDPLVDGAVLDFARLGTSRINIRANTSPATVGSVRFGLDADSNVRVEDGAPYALAGSSGPDYRSWTPGAGVHTVTATPYSEAGASGTAGEALTISFTVSDGSEEASEPAPAPPSNELPVVAIASPTEGAQFQEPATLAIVVDATDADGTVAKVEFFRDGARISEDTTAPFDSTLRDLPAGTYTLTVRGTDEMGAAATSPAVTISVVAAGTSDPRVVSFTLLDADTDAPVAGFDPIPEGAVLDLETLPKRLNIRANTSPLTVGSVRFVLDGTVVRTENGIPYALAGNSGSNYYGWTLSTGAHTVTATPYSGATATGTAGTPLTLQFTVR